MKLKVFERYSKLTILFLFYPKTGMKKQIFLQLADHF
jgi:hypothetical protein